MNESTKRRAAALSAKETLSQPSTRTINARCAFWEAAVKRATRRSSPRSRQPKQEVESSHVTNSQLIVVEAHVRYTPVRRLQSNPVHCKRLQRLPYGCMRVQAVASAAPEGQSVTVKDGISEQGLQGIGLKDAVSSCISEIPGCRNSKIKED